MKKMIGLFQKVGHTIIVAERLIAYKYGKISEIRVQNIENNLETIIKEFESMKNELLFILSENAEQEN